MAGYSKLYCVGGLGGFMGADGINPILFQILVGDADRQWFEVRYFDTRIEPLGRVRTIIPEGPDHPHALIDACIAFFPFYFRTCPLMEMIRQKLDNATRLDFDLGRDNIPPEWLELRKQALPLFKTLSIFQADLKVMDMEGYEI